MENTKINEFDMLKLLSVGAEILAPMQIYDVNLLPVDSADARINIGIPPSQEAYRFVVECKSRSTPEAIEAACRKAKEELRSEEEFPMIHVPFLSPSKLAKLEATGMSGVDLCGNGIIQVPGKIHILRTGNPNRYPDSRSVANPYRGRTALVARMLVMNPTWNSTTELTAAIREKGGQLSMSQVSKATKSMSEDLLVSKTKRQISLTDPVGILDKLAKSWSMPIVKRRSYFKVNDDLFKQLNSLSVKWAVTGQSSVSKYVTFSQGGPTQIAVTNLEQATAGLFVAKENIPNFADVELIESTDDGFYFANQVEQGINWASQIQTWLELIHGDARQIDAAKELKQEILAKAQK